MGSADPKFPVGQLCEATINAWRLKRGDRYEVVSVLADGTLEVRALTDGRVSRVLAPHECLRAVGKVS